MASSSSPTRQLIYHPQAYRFLLMALRRTQERLDRAKHGHDTAEAHVTGVELMIGVKDLALEEFGMMGKAVFNSWGIEGTDDFGRMVWEMIECGQMTKTENDQLGDFDSVFDFAEVFENNYQIDVSHAFRSR